MRAFWMALAAVLLLGCSQGTESTSEPSQPSAAQDIVNTLSQRNALEAGRKAGQQVRQIRAEQDKNLQEVDP